MAKFRIRIGSRKAVGERPSRFVRVEPYLITKKTFDEGNVSGRGVLVQWHGSQLP